jgi:hypothetical protein
VDNAPRRRRLEQAGARKPVAEALAARKNGVASLAMGRIGASMSLLPPLAVRLVHPSVGVVNVKEPLTVSAMQAPQGLAAQRSLAFLPQVLTNSHFPAGFRLCARHASALVEASRWLFCVTRH